MGYSNRPYHVINDIRHVHLTGPMDYRHSYATIAKRLEENLPRGTCVYRGNTFCQILLYSHKQNIHKIPHICITNWATGIMSGLIFPLVFPVRVIDYFVNLHG